MASKRRPAVAARRDSFPLGAGRPGSVVRTASCGRRRSPSTASSTPARGSKGRPLTSNAAPGLPCTGATTTTTLKVYAAQTWLASRDLKPSTRLLYAEACSTPLILPALGRHRLDKITPTMVRNWYAGLDAEAPTRRAHAYSLLRSIYTTAVADDLVPTNPCRIRGAGASRDQLDEGGEPRRARSDHRGDARPLPVLLAAWCGLRLVSLPSCAGDDVDSTRGCSGSSGR